MTLTNMSSTLGPDPGWADRMSKAQIVPKLCPDVYRLWAKHFSPAGDPDAVTDIPADWASFFIMMLLSPTHFDWAKGFLNSEAWRFMISCTSTVSTMSFVIPESCPVDKEPQCLSHCDSNRMSPSSLDDLPMEKKKKSSTPHVETEARRSPRIVYPVQPFHQHCQTSLSRKLKLITTSSTGMSVKVIPPTALQKARNQLVLARQQRKLLAPRK